LPIAKLPKKAIKYLYTMILTALKPIKALNKAFLKIKPTRTEIDGFKKNLLALLNSINDAESEEFHKNLVIDFLKKTYYDPAHFVNTKGRNDLVIHNGNTAQSSVGVIIEVKKPTNKAEMITTENLNAKAFQELVLYYLRERITHKNLEIKHLIVTNNKEWFIFDALIFDRLFAQNSKLVKQFNDFESGTLADTKTEFFYKEIAKPFIDNLTEEIEFTYFNLQDYQEILRNEIPTHDLSRGLQPTHDLRTHDLSRGLQPTHDLRTHDLSRGLPTHDLRTHDLSRGLLRPLITLFKIFSPEHLLKLPFANDSNTLDRKFYAELLHIIGLTETKNGNKKLIERNKVGERHTGSILEDTIIQLDSLEKISRLEKPNQFGNTKDERLFAVALELCITWINRILFLKLLEAQLLSYHKGDMAYSFLNIHKIKNYDDLNSLFFQVLARKYEDRNEDVKTAFEKVPYLNSSLFEPTELEQTTLFISNLKASKTIPISGDTVLKDAQGNKRVGNLNTLEYLFEFLNAYDFGSEGTATIQEDNKKLINAAVLGLIFEKINGYKDGSFFTPGFITMYMCRETIRKAVVQKFVESNLVSKDEVNSIEDISRLIPKKISIKQANAIINSLKICDPAVGSGHFLVSALNEIIAIKNDLKILEDRNGKSLHRYEIVVSNDELMIIDQNGELFSYNPNNKEDSRVQEAIFHEKQTIIENCLFGVDINPNAVKICRLRLWIELLKSAYYKSPLTPEGRTTPISSSSHFGGRGATLETLPNIDINIKCGNSLVSRFAIDTNLSTHGLTHALTHGLNRGLTLTHGLNRGLTTYRNAVATYRNATDKEQKREMERLIASIKADFRTEIAKNDPKVEKKRKLEGELFTLMNQTAVFELSEKEKKEKAKKTDFIAKEIAKLEAEIEEIKSNRIFENAFEWRFEFPEVLNDEGDFVGFDVVIGNPPYIRQEEIKDLKFFLQNHYEVYHGSADLYVYFIEKSIQIAANNGIISQISNNKWLIAGYGEPLRKFLLQKRLLEIINFGDQQVFVDATTYPAILSLKKEDVSLYKSNATTALPERISEMINLFKAARDVGELPEPVKQSLVIDDSIENTEIFANNIKKLLNYKKELNGLFTILQQTLDEVQNLRYQLVEQIQFRLALFNEEPSTNITRYIFDNSHTVLQNDLTAEPWIIGQSTDDKLLKKLNLKCTNLEKYVKNSYRGVLTGLTEAFVIDRATKDRLVAANSRNNEIIKPFLAGRDIKKYQSPIIDKFLILFPKGFTNKNRQLKDNSNHIIADDAWNWVKVNYPAVANHLISFQSKAENRTDKGDYWWELRACDYYDMFEKPKIMYQVLQVKPCFIYDEEGLFCNNSVWFIPSDDKVLLGILNSKIGWWLISKYCTAIQNGYQLIWKYFSQIPIAIGSVAIRTKIIDIVNQILITKKQNPAADTTALEAEIDQLVYALYDLTEEEIRIVEEV
jgi:hypothetical protein